MVMNLSLKIVAVVNIYYLQRFNLCILCYLKVNVIKNDCFQSLSTVLSAEVKYCSVYYFPFFFFFCTPGSCPLKFSHIHQKTFSDHCCLFWCNPVELTSITVMFPLLLFFIEIQVLAYAFYLCLIRLKIYFLNNT